MPNYTLLAAEVRDDPLGRGYAAMTADLITADLNTPYRTLTVPQVPVSKVAMWAAKTGVRAKIEVHAADADSPVRSVCLALQDLFRGLGSPTLDLGDADNRAMCDALAAVGVMSAGQKTSLLALQDQPLTRAVEVWGVPVQAPDIDYVRSL